MKDKPIHEIMVPLAEYPCVSEVQTLRQAVEAMKTKLILREQEVSLARVALVFDRDFRELLGKVRRRDIMRALEPKFLRSGSMPFERKLFDVRVDPNLAEISSDKIVARMRERANCLVRDFMIPITATINYDDHLMKAIHEMVDQNTSLLPVLQEGKVVGVVRSVEVLKEISLIIGS